MIFNEKLRKYKIGEELLEDILVKTGPSRKKVVGGKRNIGKLFRRTFAKILQKYREKLLKKTLESYRKMSGRNPGSTPVETM